MTADYDDRPAARSAQRQHVSRSMCIRQRGVPILLVAHVVVNPSARTHALWHSALSRK